MASKSNQSPKPVRLLMWNITPPLADFLFDVSNILQVIGAAVVLIGTVGAIKMGGIREQFSNERIAENERATAVAAAESDTAKRDAALANERAEEARTENIALARAATPRHVVFPGLGENPMLSGYLTDLAKFSGTAVFIQSADDTDAINFAAELSTALKALGWEPQLIEEQQSNVSPRVIMEGVQVLYPTGKPYTQKEPHQPWFAWHDAAEGLADALTKGGFGIGDIPVSRAGFVNRKQDFAFSSIPFFQPPLTGVYVQVGPRPASMTFQWVEQRRKRSP